MVGPRIGPDDLRHAVGSWNVHRDGGIVVRQRLCHLTDATASDHAARERCDGDGDSEQAKEFHNIMLG